MSKMNYDKHNGYNRRTQFDHINEARRAAGMEPLDPSNYNFHRRRRVNKTQKKPPELEKVFASQNP